MNNRTTQSEFRSLLSVKNFSYAWQKHYDQLIQIEKDMDQVNKDAASSIADHSTPEAYAKWEFALKKVSGSVFSINQILEAAKEKITKKDRSDSAALWQQFDVNLSNLKLEYKNLESFGNEMLPENARLQWKKDIFNVEDNFMPLVVTYVESCKIELQMIEKYTPEDLQKINQIILQHIPKDFTAAEADEYEKDYISALADFQQEFREEKNLWDTFLDILAGGTHQSPSERIMMERWVDGEKGSL